MLHPLASLWRHPTRVSFYGAERLAGHAVSLAGGLASPSAIEARRRFASTDDAFHYLRYWMAEPHARAELKWILQRSGPSLAGVHGGVDGWLRALAARMAAGAVVVVEEKRGAAAPGRLVAPASAGPAAVDIDALPPLSAASAPAPVPATQAGTQIEQAAAAPLTVEPEWSASAADQLVQAETLEEAARLGAPFCEICAAMRQDGTGAAP